VQEEGQNGPGERKDRRVGSLHGHNGKPSHGNGGKLCQHGWSSGERDDDVRPDAVQVLMEPGDSLWSAGFVETLVGDACPLEGRFKETLWVVGQNGDVIALSRQRFRQSHNLPLPTSASQIVDDETDIHRSTRRQISQSDSDGAGQACQGVLGHKS
jgi:hypothetical protein